VDIRFRRFESGDGAGIAAFDDDVTEEFALSDEELVEFHQLEQGEEGDDHFRLGGGALEQFFETPGFTGLEVLHEQFDFIGNIESIVDDIAEIMGFFEAFQDILEGADQIENRDLGQARWFFLREVRSIRLMGEAAFLFEFPEGEESGGVFEFFVFDELTDEFPAWIVILGIFFGWLIDAREEGPAFQIHQVCRHDDELGSEVDVEQFEGVDVIEILPRDALDGNSMNVHLILFDEVEQEIEGALEDFEAHFVVVGFHRAGGRGLAASERVKFPSPWWRRTVLLMPLKRIK